MGFCKFESLPGSSPHRTGNKVCGERDGAQSYPYTEWKWESEERKAWRACLLMGANEYVEAATHAMDTL